MADPVDIAMRRLAGPDHIEQHVLLLRLSELIDDRPDFGSTLNLEVDSSQRQWFAKSRALLDRVSSSHSMKFDFSFNRIHSDWRNETVRLQGIVLDTIEELKLNLEIDGRSEIGTIYKPGESYKFFTELKSIIDAAKKRIRLVDPYLDGKSFDSYLSDISTKIPIQIITNKYVKQVKDFAQRHSTQFSTNIEVLTSAELHDRVLIVDDIDCWIIGSSIKDAGKKTTYLIPLKNPLSQDKISVYRSIASRSI